MGTKSVTIIHMANQINTRLVFLWAQWFHWVSAAHRTTSIHAPYAAHHVLIASIYFYLPFNFIRVLNAFSFFLFRISVCVSFHPKQSPTPPQYVYWQKNDRMINYDDSRRDISIDTIPGLRTQSRLIIREPQTTDSGNYTCSASNTEPASIYVFVSKGKYSLPNLRV